MVVTCVLDLPFVERWLINLHESSYKVKPIDVRVHCERGQQACDRPALADVGRKRLKTN